MATQALAAISASGGLSGMLPGSTRVMIRSPTSGLSTPRLGTVPLPGSPGGAPSLLPADPVSLPSLPGSVPGTSVVSSPLGTGMLSSPAVSVPMTPYNSPASAMLMLPPSPTRRPGSPPPPMLGSTGSMTLPALPMLPPASPLPTTPLALPMYTSPRIATPLPLPRASTPLPLPGAPLAVLGTPALPLALPLGSVPRGTNGSVTTFPMTGGVSPRSILPGSVALQSSTPLPLPGSVVTAAETAPQDAAALLSLGPASPARSVTTTTRTTTPVLTTASPVPRPLSSNVVTALPSASRAFSSYAAGISENSIDDLLMTKGYLRLDTITLDTDQEKVFYVKAIDPVGDIVFIQMDKSGGLTVQLSNRTVVKVSEGTSIPHSVKVRAAECAGSSVCGVAFQCEGEFCFVNRKDDGKLYEGTFVTSETASDKKITPFGSPVAYPIITLSEIEANNDNAIERVRKATMDIQAAAYASSLATITDVRKGVVLLSQRLETLSVGYTKMHEFRNMEVKKSLQLIDEYRRLPQPLSAENQDKYKQVVDKLYSLNVTFIQLVTFMREYSATQKLIDDMVVKANDSVNSLFVEARRTYDKNVSKAIRNPVVWGLPAQLDKVENFDDFIHGRWPTDMPVPESPAVTGLRRLLKT